MDDELYAATFRPRDARDRLQKYMHGQVRSVWHGAVYTCAHKHQTPSEAYECAESALAGMVGEQA